MKTNKDSTKPYVNIQVAIRCRPNNDSEASESKVVFCQSSSKEVSVTNIQPGKTQTNKSFLFDRVYDETSSQAHIYDNTILPIVEEVLEGFNCTVFAYGQTGTGKTHTMEGILQQGHSEAGMIPRSIETIFNRLESNEREYSVCVSHLELYNEELCDLLSDGENRLRIFEDNTTGSVFVNNLEEIIVNNASDIFNILSLSMQKRKTAETLMNKHSSRSHCIFTITIHTKETTPGGQDIIKTGKLNLVDLAGSECVGRSGAKDKRAKEAGKINQSLLTLGRVITSLVDNTFSHIPYRDSKLTRLLQESLGGKCKTAIVATICNTISSLDETLSTLDYAYRAKNIKNRPEVNQRTTQKGYIKELTQIINRLRQENDFLRKKNGIHIPEDIYDSLQKELKQKSDLVDTFEDRIEHSEIERARFEGLFQQATKHINDLEEQKRLIESNLSRTRHELENTKKELHKTEYLLEKRENSLKNLTSVAASMEDSIHGANEQIEKLHSKIDVQTELEAHNTVISSKLGEELSSSFENIQKKANLFRDAQTRALSLLNKRTTAFAKHSTDQLNLIASVVNARINSVLQNNDITKEISEKQKTCFKMNDSSLKALHQDFIDTIQNKNEQENLILNQLSTEINQSLASNHTSFVNWMQSLTESLKTQNQNIVLFTSDHIDAIHSVEDQVLKLSNQQISSAVTTQTMIRKLVANQNTNNEKFISSMINSLRGFAATSQNSLEDAVLDINKHYTNATDSLHDSTAKINFSLNSLQNSCKTMANDHKSDIDVTIKKGKEEITECSERSAAIFSILSNGMDTIIHHSNDTVKSINLLGIQCEDVLNNQLKEMNQLVSDSEDTRLVSNTQIHDAHYQLQDYIETSNSVGTSAAQSVTSFILNPITQTLNHSEEEFASTQNLSESITTYLSKGLKRYKKTNRTPTRKIITVQNIPDVISRANLLKHFQIPSGEENSLKSNSRLIHHIRKNSGSPHTPRSEKRNSPFVDYSSPRKERKLSKTTLVYR